MSVYISERFKKAVVTHIVKHSLSQNFSRPSLILGIHGSPGDGKTFQCEKLLEELEIKPFLISGGQLESYHAGDPAALIRSAYIEASRSIDKKESKASVVLINDIDAVVGDWGEMVQYTVNRQSIFAQLMHLCDFPNSVEGFTTHSIPVILTGNDFSKLYNPLTRSGRMTSFEWIPTEIEKIEVIKHIYPELTSDEIKRLFFSLNDYLKSNFPKISAEKFLSVAFFASLKDGLLDDLLWNKIRPSIFAAVHSICTSKTAGNLYANVTYDLLFKTAINHIGQHQLKNHLER